MLSWCVPFCLAGLFASCADSVETGTAKSSSSVACCISPDERLCFLLLCLSGAGRIISPLPKAVPPPSLFATPASALKSSCLICSALASCATGIDNQSNKQRECCSSKHIEINQGQCTLGKYLFVSSQ